MAIEQEKEFCDDISESGKGFIDFIANIADESEAVKNG